MAGCSLLGSKEDILPQDGPTMREVYDGHFGKTPSNGRHQGEPLGQGPGEGTGHLAGYTRDAHTEIQALFPQLPNPPLVMYVFPHLNGNGRPVPGYATSFPFYEKPEYALPGESGGHP
jgi:conjugative transfer region lipoprotein (TIGR03751 family)